MSRSAREVLPALDKSAGSVPREEEDGPASGRAGARAGVRRGDARGGRSPHLARNPIDGDEAAHVRRDGCRELHRQPAVTVECRVGRAVLRAR
eukprot:5338698-Prymnesium_polylepis.1